MNINLHCAYQKHDETRSKVKFTVQIIYQNFISHARCFDEAENFQTCRIDDSRI